MEKELTEEELRATYPEWTCYILEDDGEIKTIYTADHNIQRGKTYQDCCEAMKKNGGGKWREKQDKDLYQVVKKLEEERKQRNLISEKDVAERLSEIKYDIERLLDDLEE